MGVSASFLRGSTLVLLTLELCPSSYTLTGMDREKERISGACVRVHEDAAQGSCPGHSLARCRGGRHRKPA